MSQAPSASKNTSPTLDRLTLIAISALAYIIATGLHEHLGHTLTCILLGARPVEVGAFYVDCNYATLSATGIRLVALAGPLVSLLIGIFSFLFLKRQSLRSSAAFYFVWLLGSIGFMSATGYLLFSGLSGLGDFGTGPDGVFYQASPEWLWRALLTLSGLVSYAGIIYLSVRILNPRIAGLGRARIGSARQLANTSYLTGALVSVGIGLLNPYGFVIVATSAVASSLGATSGLLWMMQLLDLKLDVPAPGLTVERSWGWIALGAIVTVLYALILGPTLHP